MKLLTGTARVVETTDLDRAENILSSTYGDLRLSARGQRRGIRLAQTSLSPLIRFDHNRFMMNFEVKRTSLGVLAIGHLRDGLVTYGAGENERSYRRGDVFLAFQPEHSYTATVQDTEVELAVIDPALLSQLADTEPGRTQQPVRFTGYEPISPQAAGAWKDAYAYIRDTVLASPAAAGEPLLVSSATRLLVATALVTFPNNAFTDPTIEDRRDGSPSTVRRAVTFIDEHAHQNITVADIAAAAFVTIRAVQLAFRRHLDTTPLEYLRRVRLEHAHQDLLTADPAHVTITAVAYRWGFPSPSRFASYYRQAYGVPPSYTLRPD